MADTEKLDIGKLSPAVEDLQKVLLSKIIGQDRAIRQIIKAYVPTTVNMHRSNRPMGVFLFLGPTGVGKSETVKEFARVLLGRKDALTKIDCTEFQHDHEVAKLLGAPPGYIGYNAGSARLSQAAIDSHQTTKCKRNIVLFDEIEKADDRLFDAIMGILGDGVAVLGSGEKVDFSRTFIFLTSNLGSREVRALIEGKGIGYKQTEVERDELDDKIYRASKAAVEKKFRPEFINRLDKLVVYRSLTEETLRKILRKELAELQWRIWQAPFKDWKVGEGPTPERLSIKFRLTDSAFNFILKEGTSDLYGARELNRSVDRYVSFPLSSLISSEQLVSGDHLKISYVDGEKELTFAKDPNPPK